MIMYKRFAAIVLSAGFCLLASGKTGEGIPQIVWASDPVRPGETLVVMGEGFSSNCVVELADRVDAQKWTALQSLQATPQSLKALLPQALKMDTWACRVRDGGTVSAVEWVNEPEIWWWRGDSGNASATPGGWLRVFGKNLCFSKEARAVLQAAGGKAFTLTPQGTSNYAATFKLPADVPAGAYTLRVANGTPGAGGCAKIENLVIHTPEAWKQTVYNIKDFGRNPAQAIIAALKMAETNGGGIVYLPRGRYAMQGALTIPSNTILRGEAMALTSLYWPDLETPPDALVTGVDFGIESLSLYCQNHRHVVRVSNKSQRFFANRVRIRANCYFMIEEASKPFRGRQGPATHSLCGAAFHLGGSNFEVTDCDIYASKYGVYVINARDGVIARNLIRYGGRGYTIESTERLIFEDNLVEGNNLLSIGNDIATFWKNACMHLYYANNRVRQMYGADREMMTLDAAGGAYIGTLASALGSTVVLAADPVFKDYAPKPHTNWVGACIQIMEGKGAGQYRIVQAHSGREWQIDRPWKIVPDAKSLISIAPFRGRNLFINNTFEDGGPFQLYAASHESIVAGNKGSRMDGFTVWGLNPHGWGLQPSWYNQFIDNEVLEGNGYGHRSATLGTISSDETKLYQGPMIRCTIFRGNILQNNAQIVINGATDDTLIENNTLRNSDTGIFVKPSARNTLIRGNGFEHVEQQIKDEGMQTLKMEP